MPAIRGSLPSTKMASSLSQEEGSMIAVVTWCNRRSSIINHPPQLTDVIPPQRLRTLHKALASSKRQQALHGRLEVVAPAHGQVEMLLLQRNKGQPLAPRRGLDAHANICLALADGQGQVVLAERWVLGPRKVASLNVVASEQAL